ncbi:hypothetical protein M3Y99_01220700 [Aphelenchoides fujianensis]|nr:hypothetical protein M3Y99_01220700 [Aphelenchoides fujianensis]
MSTPLLEALEVEDYAQAIALVAEDPALIVGRDASGRIALHYAAETANAEVFGSLLEADPSLIDAQDSNGFTPLFVAVTANNVEVVRLLIERGTQLDQVDFDKHTVVHWAVVCGQLESRMPPITTPDIHGAHPLHYAVTLDDMSPERVEAILSALLKVTKNVNCRDADDRTPLLWAASCGNTSAVQRLMEAGANKYAVDRDHLNALHCAANHGYDETDKNGDTPLFYACTYGHYECARLLLEDANVDPNHVDKRLRTAAHCAAAKGQMRTLRLLRQYGASFDMANYRGDLPLHESVQTGNIEVVQWLLALSPTNVSVGNFYGRTALHLAAANGDLELVRLLCERGAPVNALMIYRNQMCTALDLARQRRHQPVVDYLRGSPYGAQYASDMNEREVREARAEVEENVRLAKLRWTQVRERRSSSVNGDLRLPPIPTSSAEMINREAQTDEAISNRIGREMIEEAIRRVVADDSIRGLRSSLAANPHRLPAVRQNGTSRSPPTDDDYPTQPNTDTELLDSAHNSSRPPPKIKKRVTMEGGTRVREFDYEDGESEDEKTAEEVAKRVGSRSGRLISGLVPLAATGANERFVHEKAIFQELTHLKRVQIQYGKVQEKILVRSLINNFCKMHGLNPAHFRYNSFYAWEKFLYEQLKLIYLEERDRIQTVRSASHSSVVGGQFERRLRKVSPLNDRIRELTRIYNSAAKKRIPPTPPSRRPRLQSRLSTERTESAHGRRCNCLDKNHSHLLLNNT